MANKFVCGRLILNKDGIVKKLHLADGGGTRDCTISHIDMGFDEIHDRLRDIFSLNPRESISKLYDFERKELDRNRYVTFYDYVQKNGLKFKGTLLYLCTPTDNEDFVHNTSSPEKRRRTTTLTIQNSSTETRSIRQVEADSSTPPVLIKIDDVPQSIEEPEIDQRIIENLRISSFENYSFEKSLNEFIDYLRRLINEYHRENILIELFEHICTIRGLVLIILDPLKQQIQSIDEYQKSIYNDGLNKIDKLSRTINAFIQLNKMKISHIDQHAIIYNSFNQFHQNFNILRERWNNRHNTSHSSTDYSVDPTPTTSFASSASSRYHSENNSRKRSYPSSSSSYRRTNTEDDNNEKYSLFKNLLNSLDNLLDVLHQRRFTSFYYLVESLIGEIKSSRSTIQLSDARSLYNTEQIIIKIEGRLTNRINDEYHHASPHRLHQQLEYSFNKSLDAIRHLLNSIKYYQTQINKYKRTRTTHHHHHHRHHHHRSSPFENKPIISKTNEESNRIDDDDDDQSSEASHSSIGDEVLMEVARDAYEQRPNRSK